MVIEMSTFVRYETQKCIAEKEKEKRENRKEQIKIDY